MRETAASKALRVLGEGRLIVLSVQRGRVTASCRGEGAVWLQSYADGVWRCSCPVRSTSCSHLIALRRVTAPDLDG